MHEIKKKIIHLAENSGKRGIPPKEVCRKLKIKGKWKQEFEQILEELLQSGVLYLKKGQLFSAKKQNVIVAKITRINRTFGFARALDHDTEFFIPGKFLLGSMPEDLVLLKPIRGRGSSPEGEVCQVIEQNCNELTGKILFEQGQYSLLCDSMMKTALPMKKHQLNGAHDGDKVLAQIVSRGKRHSEHKIEVKCVYGSADHARACAAAILERNSITAEFSNEILDLAKMIQKKGIQEKDYFGRTDLRNELIFTIDSAEAKDLDDAVSIHKYEDCYQLGVHIADVSHYVKRHSLIDEEAFCRGTSIYYADKVIPMLPRALSNGICSLSPGENRLTLSCLMTLDLEGNLIDFDFQKTVICSRVKGVYSEINRLLSGDATPAIQKKYSEVFAKLKLMKELAQLREKLKRQRGAPEIVTSESKIIVDERGIAVDILPRSQGLSERIIEEFMLLANESAAMAAKVREVPFVYRIHEPPAPEKLDQLNLTLRRLGVQNRALSPNIKPKALAEILEKAKGSPLFSVINMQVLRAMSKAKYSENPIGHYGLALENYTHFTSPIRRYADLEIHRVISELLGGSEIKIVQKKYGKDVAKAAKQASNTELIAVRIERECEDCYKAEYMKAYIGEEFDGMITSAAPHGIYVTLPNTIEGLIKLDDLPKGEYYYDEVMEYRNLTTGQSFKVGDPIRICCAGCDVNQGNIDFTLVLPEEMR